MSKELQDLHKIIITLQQKVEFLEKKVNTLNRENLTLKNRLSKYETPKNSNNSSVPPSKDENRPKRKSLREKSGRKPGGQKGRKGNTLKMVENPDFIEQRSNKLLEYYLPPGHKELIAFQKRLIKYRGYLFTFLYYPKVPPDNNASERAIRNIKVKQKVSGQFKTPHGAFIFAVLRSVTDTIIKNNQNVFKSLQIIANLHTD